MSVYSAIIVALCVSVVQSTTETATFCSSNVEGSTEDTLERAGCRYISALENGSEGEWNSLFTDQGTIEDPVGAEVLSGASERARFWKMFLKHKSMDVAQTHPDVVHKDAFFVVKTLQITSTAVSGARHTVPMHVHLQFSRNTTESQFALSALRSFWDPSESVPVVSAGYGGAADIPRFFVGSILSLVDIWGYTGVAGVVHYVTALSVGNVGPEGKALANKINHGHDTEGIFTEGAKVHCVIQAATINATAAHLADQVWTNLHSSGRHVSFTTTKNDITGAGFVSFEKSSLLITEVSIYSDNCVV